MKYHIFNEEKKPIAMFENEIDRNDFLDLLKEKYPDCKWDKFDY